MKRPAVVFPDVESEVVAYLRTRFTGRAEPFVSGVQVSNRVPASIPTRFVWVRDDGGGKASDVTRAARVAVNVFAGSRDDAVDLANLTSALLQDAPGNRGFVGLGFLNGPYGVAEESGRHRQYLTLELHVRGSALQ